jgi:hypothetical protein
LTRQYRPQTPNGFGSISCYGSLPLYRAQTSNEAPNFETARTLSTGSEFSFFPENLKDFKPHYVFFDNYLYGAVPDRRAESFDGNLGRKGTGAGAQAEGFIFFIAPGGGRVKGRIPRPARKSSFLRLRNGPLSGGAGEMKPEFFSAHPIRRLPWGPWLSKC